MKIEKIYEKNINKMTKKTLKNIKKIGKYEIQDDKIVCYVNTKKMIRNSKTKNYYELNFAGINNTFNKMKKICNICDLNKPIYYIVDGAKFDKNVNITCYLDTNVLFKNCIFNENINVLSSQNITFENNIYNNINLNKIDFKVSADNLKLINENNFNSEDLQFDFKCNNLDIINTKTNSNKLTRLNLHAKNINVLNSELMTTNIESTLNIESENLCLKKSIIFIPNIDINSREITSFDSIVDATSQMNIYNENCNILRGFTTNYLIYNDNLYSDPVEKVSEESNKMHTARIKLLSVLENLRNKCYSNIVHKAVNKTKKLQKQKVNKLIK